MKTKITLLIFFLCLTIFSFSQQDNQNRSDVDDEPTNSELSLLDMNNKSLNNQLDSTGKKDGTWIEYLNAKWKVLKDSNHAVYCRYVYYDHGKNIMPQVNNDNKKIEFIGDTTKKTKPFILDGEYKWYDRKGRLLTDECYKNGERVWFKGYTWGIFNKKMTGKNIHEYYDFTKKYKGQAHTCYLELTDKKGVVTIYYIRKDKLGWCAYGE